MGGKNPLVVLDDADLQTAVNCAVQGSYYSTGQRCTASSRLVVTAGIHDRFVAAVADKLKTLRVDNALLTGTDIGPVVDESQLDVDLKYLAVGKGEGARLVTGGERLQRATDGYYLSPALFTEAGNAMRIAREEIFGPVACVIRAKDYDEALAIANDTEFGLGAGLWTRDMNQAYRMGRGIQAGRVWTNCYHHYPAHAAFGGYKKSGVGRETHKMMLDHYQQTKNLLVSYDINPLGFF
jgi:aldehyde dehydrogenase